jgi:hypothetical protein
MAYHVEVKIRGPYAKPWKWEIHEGGKPLWVERSVESFGSRSEAEWAGNSAMERLENRRSLGRDQ